MAKRTIQRHVTFVLSIPFRMASRYYVSRNICGIQADLVAALKIIDRHVSLEIDNLFITTLIIAEDNRNSFHYGVDPIGMFRAVKARICHGERQGASTIEQQFVRVVTNKYERSLKRKFHEQMLAVAISKQRDRNSIAKAYLAIAYYGTGLIGIKGIMKKCPSGIKPAQDKEAIALISRLKYPEPKRMSCRWLTKHENRNRYISKRCAGL